MAFEIDYYYRWNERIVADAVALDADSGAVSEILTVNLTPSRLLLSDASGKIIVSSLVTSTEANYLSGVTSNIQTQLNAKQATLTLGNLTEVTSSVLTVTGGTGAIIGSGLTIQVKLAGAAQSGYLSTTDWNTFNNKLSTSLTAGYVWIGNGSNVATAFDSASAGDILASTSTGLTIKAGVIVDADVNASAAITRTKLAAGTAYRILANNASGVMSENAAITASRAVASDANGQLVASATTATQLGYSSTLTADIQVQLDTLITGNTTNALVQTPTITQDGFAITWNNTAGEYTLTDPVVQGIPAAGTANYALIKNTGTDYDASWTAITLSHVSDVNALAADVDILVGGAAAGVTATEFQYLNGVTSAIQTQLDAKQSSSLAQDAIWYGNASGIATQLSPGTSGYILTSVGGSPQWQPATGLGITVGTTIITSGTDTRVPFNDGGVYNEDASFSWNKTDNILTVGSTRIFNKGGGAILNTYYGQLSGNTTSTTASANIGIGVAALPALTTGSNNIAMGYQSLFILQDGDYNIGIGNGAIGSNVSGDANIGIGFGSLGTVTASNNIGIGFAAGDNISSGSNNLIIGTSVDAQSATESNQLSVQNAIFGSANSATGTTISTGNLGFYANTWGTSAAKVLSFGSGTAPSTSPADMFQLYSADIAAGNAAAHFRTELGQIIKLYTANAGSAYAITNGTTDRTVDANATTVEELADLVYTLVEDLKLTGLIV